MATITDYADRTSSDENITVTLTPAVGDNYIFNAFGESIPAIIGTVEWSADAGSNFFDPSAELRNLTQVATATGTVLNSPITIHLNDGSRWRYTTPGTVGTYIISSIGTIWS